MTELSLSVDQWELSPEPVRKFCFSLLSRYEKLAFQLSSVKSEERLASFASIARARPRTPKSVVFVVEEPTIRHLKLASGLQRLGWSVVLLHRRPLMSDGSTYFSQTIQFLDREECLLFACMFSPVAYHVFSCWNFEVAEYFVRHKPGKVVFESYDVLGGAVRPEVLGDSWRRTIAIEKLCFENADGVSARNLQVRHVKKTLGYRLPKNVIFFPDYCWNHSQSEAARMPKRTDGIHFVYVGGCAGKYFHAEPWRAGPNSRACIEAITRHGIHYHIYPFLAQGLTLSEHLSEYVDYSKTNPLFHIHEPLAADALLKEISQYHVGIFSMAKGSFAEGDHVYIPSYFNQFSANKIFDYLDAGLPSIIGSGRLVDKLMQRTGASEIGYLDDFSAHIARILEPGKLSALSANTARGRALYAIDRHAARLAHFYETLGVSTDKALSTIREQIPYVAA